MSDKIGEMFRLDMMHARLSGQQEQRKAHSPAPAGSAAEVESEVCSSCEGYGSISYNPNLNPNAFPATATAKCTHCGGNGSVEKAKPQPNGRDERPGGDKPTT